MNKLKIKLLNDVVDIPVRAHSTDAGLDLKSCKRYDIMPNNMQIVSTGISIALDPGYVGLVFSRSGMGKDRIRLSNSVGVIDAAYRGELKVMVENNGDYPFLINPGDRIAQLVILPVFTPETEIFEGSDEEWNNTDRGTKGFGSTGFQTPVVGSSTKTN